MWAEPPGDLPTLGAQPGHRRWEAATRQCPGESSSQATSSLLRCGGLRGRMIQGRRCLRLVALGPVGGLEEEACWERQLPPQHPVPWIQVGASSWGWVSRLGPIASLLGAKGSKPHERRSQVNVGWEATSILCQQVHPSVGGKTWVRGPGSATAKSEPKSTSVWF